MPLAIRRPRACRPQLESSTPLVAIAVARQVIEEAGQWLGVPLPARYAAGLAHRARRIFAHSAAFRARLRRPGHDGRDWLYAFMRHWLAARLGAERPDLYARLPRSFDVGEPLSPAPVRPVARGASRPAGPALVNDGNPWLSPDARLLLAM